MRVVPGTPTREQQAAFANRDVETIAEAIVAHIDDPRFLRLAYDAMFRTKVASRAVLQARLGGDDADPTAVDAAEEVARAGVAIQSLTDEVVKGRRLGAVLERLVWRLCGKRKPDDTAREAHVALTTHKHVAAAQTGRIDVLVDSDPFEVYECKLGSGIEQSNIDELGEIYVTAQAEGTTCVPCIATMGSEAQLRTRVDHAGLVLDEVLYFAELSDLPILATRPPSRRFR